MSRVETEKRSSPAGRADPKHGERNGATAQSKFWRWSWLPTVAGPLVVGFAAAVASSHLWLPPAGNNAAGDGEPNEAEHGDHVAASTCTGHDHGGNEGNSIELSEQGRKNIGLTLATVEPRDYQRTVSIPAVLVDRPGRTEITVSTPMTGIVSRVAPIPGEAVSPGSPLFELRLTHEDLVEKQSQLLRAVEELDVVNREVARLEEVTASGAVAGKRLLEREYEQQKIEAIIRAEREALILHGLSEEQIDAIIQQRRLLKELAIDAPELPDCGSNGNHEEYLQVAELSVTPGEHVTAGTPLCKLNDHCQLYIEGKAFEHDAEALNKAANEGVALTAIVENNGPGDYKVPGLKILYVQNEVEMDSRALKFYVLLNNDLVRNELTPEGHRFIGWRYKPGQRVELLVPVETWKNRIVLPVEAIVQEGAERFVYQQQGNRFDRRSVHVEFRDQRHAVIENDGTLFPGDSVAADGAYQIHLAIKNQSGGGADPHAGHHH